MASSSRVPATVTTKRWSIAVSIRHRPNPRARLEPRNDDSPNRAGRLKRRRLAMKKLREFVFNALVGGFLVVVPVYLAVLLLLKAAGSISGLVRPIASLLPQWWLTEDAL